MNRKQKNRKEKVKREREKKRKGSRAQEHSNKVRPLETNQGKEGRKEKDFHRSIKSRKKIPFFQLEEREERRKKTTTLD